MNIEPGIFKSYDIRGIYPTQINEENIVVIIKAIYTFLSKNINKPTITVALGRDMRVSSPSLTAKTQETLISMGASVVDIGLVSTPTFYFSVFNNKYDCGIQITASHNPKEYNGVKIVRFSPTGLIKIGKPTGMEDIKNLALQAVPNAPTGQGSVSKKEGSDEEEVKAALACLDNPPIKKYKIVADTANAMGALYIEALFKKVPADLVTMNFNLDGTFPAHQPDPLQSETLVDLQKRVITEKADFGLAPDGDGDRLFFIDEKGEIVQPTLITSLIAKELLQNHPRERILVDIRYIFTPQKIVQEYNGIFDITKVGHAFITEQLNKTGGIFAGESSAHYFYRSTGNAESQVLTILYVLKAMSETGKSLSALVEDMRRSFESGEINFRVTNAKEILEYLKEKYKDGQISELDGIAVSYQDWRFNVRTSNTEPLLRLNVEALSKDTMLNKKEELISRIKEKAVTDSQSPSH